MDLISLYELKNVLNQTKNEKLPGHYDLNSELFEKRFVSLYWTYPE